MLTEFLFISVIVVVLFNLISSTEKTLAHRPVPVEKDKRIIDHRSRM